MDIKVCVYRTCAPVQYPDVVYIILENTFAFLFMLKNQIIANTKIVKFYRIILIA